MSNSWVVTKQCKTGNWVDGVCIDNIGNVYFTVDSAGLWKWNVNENSDNPICLWEGNKEEGTISMRGIVWNGHNILYICEERSFRILQYDVEKRLLTTFAGTGEQGHKDGNMTYASFWCPWGIAMDRNSYLYITDQHCIRKIDNRQRTVETVAGSASWIGGYKDGSTADALFRYLTGILILDDDTMYVCDSGNSVVRKLKDGMVSSHPSKACFGSPRGIIRDMDCNLLIADFLVIRKLEIESNSVKNITNFLHVKHPRSLARQMYWIAIGTLDQLIILEHSWVKERLLWIGKLKEDAKDCCFAALPQEIIKEIAYYISLQRDVKRKSRKIPELPCAKKKRIEM